MLFRIFVLLSLPVLLTAQTTSIVRNEGEVYLNNQAVSAPSTQITYGAVSVIRTGSGRAQIDLREGGKVFLGPNSMLIIDDQRSSNFTELDILAGSVLLAPRGRNNKVTCEDAVLLSDSGLYRFTVQAYADSNETYCRLNVVAGAAEVQLVSRTAMLSHGEEMNLNRRCGDMIPKSRFDPTALDEFERWARPLL